MKSDPDPDLKKKIIEILKEREGKRVDAPDFTKLRASVLGIESEVSMTKFKRAVGYLHRHGLCRLHKQRDESTREVQMLTLVYLR